MPNLTIYINDSLAARISRNRDKIKISRVCSAAISRFLDTFDIDQVQEEKQLVDDFLYLFRNGQSKKSLTQLIKLLRSVKAELYLTAQPVKSEKEG